MKPINVTGRPPVEIRASEDLLVQVYDGLFCLYESAAIIDNLEGNFAGVGPNEIDGLIAALLQARNLMKYGHIGTMRQWKEWECNLMNWLDFRYWFCDCHYMAPFGKVIMGGCKRHD